MSVFGYVIYKDGILADVNGLVCANGGMFFTLANAPIPTWYLWLDLENRFYVCRGEDDIMMEVAKCHDHPEHINSIVERIEPIDIFHAINIHRAYRTEVYK